MPNGAEGDRTPNLFIANEALSQLSYGPKLTSRHTISVVRPGRNRRNGNAGRDFGHGARGAESNSLPGRGGQMKSQDPRLDSSSRIGGVWVLRPPDSGPKR